MPWKCPACQIAIRHSDAEPHPRPNVVYRCHACRLELVLDQHANTMAVPPFVDEPGIVARRGDRNQGPARKPQRSDAV